jgi:uncharacterized protein (DUF2062 family)
MSRWRSWRARAATLRSVGWKRLRGGDLTPTRAAASVGLGLFIGCLPLYGLHLPLVLAACVPLRLDAPVAYLASNISNPLVAPWLLVAEVQTGSWLLTRSFVGFNASMARATGITGYAAYAALGSVAVGGVVALVGACCAGIISARWASRT